LSIPITLFFVCLVVLTTVLIRFWYESAYMKHVLDPMYVKYFYVFQPTTVQAIMIIIFGKLYQKIVFWLVNGENHRFDGEHENSLISKMYLFDFINSYFTSLYYAFYVNRFSLISQNLITILAAKQIGMNLIEWAQDKILVGRKLKKIRNQPEFAENRDKIAKVEHEIQGIRDKIKEIDGSDDNIRMRR